MFSFAALLYPIITAGFQEPLDWETGLDEEMYNLQSEPTFYNSYLAGLRQLLGLFSSCDSVPSHSFYEQKYYFGTCVIVGFKM